MNYLIIDVGTYSIKFLVIHIERKKRIEIISNAEYVISHYLEQGDNQDDTSKHNLAIQSIIGQYFQEKNFAGKIITQLPSDLISTRSYKIPIKNRKKAELALPFQLEEDIPFSVSEIHYASLLKLEGEGTQALVAFTPRVHFDEFYESFQGLGVIPDIITSEESSFAQFVSYHETDDPFCIIDLGHSTSKAYFFENRKLVSSQLSYIAGETINKAIAKNYNISSDEAQIYKHQNSFFLTAEQYKSVNKQQKEFANLMKLSFSALVSDIKRWMIGYRLKTGNEITKVYLTGGCSNVKNIHNFIHEQIGVPTFRLKAFKGQSIGKIDTDKKIENKFALSTIIGISAINRKGMINFRTGEYSPSGADVLPVFSLSFLGMRTAILTLIVIVSLAIEIGIQSKQLAALNKDIRQTLKKKNLQLKISPRLVKRFNRKRDDRTAKSILSVLKKSVRTQKSTILAMEQASKINAVKPLIQLSESLSPGKDIMMTQYEFRDKKVKATFESDKKNNLLSFKDTLLGLDLLNRKVQGGAGAGGLTLSFNVRE
jgi:Tfp pilus assembly PilM family ATPase